MRRSDDMDALLRRSLSSGETPDPKLIGQVKFKLQEGEPTMKKIKLPAFTTKLAAAAVVAVLLCTSAFAARYFITAREFLVSTAIQDPTLAAAFDSEYAIDINESITSGEYTFTLLSVVSGENITDSEHYTYGVLQPDRTYVFLAIEHADGTPIPPTWDDEYWYVERGFTATPLLKGTSAFDFNLALLNGDATWYVVDGILYYVFSFNNVEMFADRGVYIGVNDRVVVSPDVFPLDEATGEFYIDPNYEGSAAIFKLPLDESLADPEKAEAVLEEIVQSRHSKYAEAEIPVGPAEDAAAEDIPAEPAEDVTVNEIPAEPAEDVAVDEIPAGPAEDAAADEVPAEPAEDAAAEDIPAEPEQAEPGLVQD